MSLMYAPGVADPAFHYCDMTPYLQYWLDGVSLGHPYASDEPRLQQLQNYIRRYEFVGVVTLPERLDDRTGRARSDKNDASLS